MPLTGEYAPIQADWVREQVEQIERTGTTEGIEMKNNQGQDTPIVLMVCKGAKSGLLRRTPVMRVEHDGAYAVVASKGGAPENPGWYRNLIDHPVADLQDGTDKAEYTARVLRGDERAQWWDRAVAVWPDYAEYQKKTDREIPVLVLERAS